MSKIGYMVYWTDCTGACSRLFTEAEMGEALRFMNDDLRRRESTSFVTFVSQMSGSVGRPGVDTIKDGKTPDGQLYDWSKQHRGAGPSKL